MENEKCKFCSGRGSTLDGWAVCGSCSGSGKIESDSTPPTTSREGWNLAEFMKNSGWKEITAEGNIVFKPEKLKELFTLAKAETRKATLEEIKQFMEKSRSENLEAICKNENCSDPICGHGRCIEWMYGPLTGSLDTLLTRLKEGKE